MDTAAIQAGAVSAGAPGFSENRTAQALNGDQFFQLLIAQLSNQDPLEPTSNQELLQQISSIRDIELSTQLVESLSSLTGQQQYGTAASLIGRFVTSRPDPAVPNSTGVQGVVRGVRFAQDGTPFLQLDNGLEVSIRDVETIIPAEEAANALVGKMVTGIDTSDADDPRVTEGIVTEVRTEPDGSVKLELDNGRVLDLENVVAVQDPSPSANAKRRLA